MNSKIQKDIAELINEQVISQEVASFNNYLKTLHFDLPFNRYYMEESKAYKAEVVVREN